MKKTINLLAIAFLIIFASAFTSTPKVIFAKKLSKYCKTLPNEFNQISDERKKDIMEMGDYIIKKRVANTKCNLLFICTSNSRRSHMECNRLLFRLLKRIKKLFVYL